MSDMKFPHIPEGFIGFPDALVQIKNITHLNVSGDDVIISMVSGHKLTVINGDIVDIATTMAGMKEAK